MKKNIIIVIFILIIGLGLGILIYNYDDNNSNKNNELEQLLNNINKINKIFNSTNLNTANSYEDNNGIVCKEYIGDDVETYLKLLKETYVNPFFEDGYFQMVYDDKNNEKLFICNPQCIIITYNTENSKIIEANGKKYLNANNNEIELIEDNNYKLNYPLVSCK